LLFKNVLPFSGIPLTTSRCMPSLLLLSFLSLSSAMSLPYHDMPCHAIHHIHQMLQEEGGGSAGVRGQGGALLSSMQCFSTASSLSCHCFVIASPLPPHCLVTASSLPFTASSLPCHCLLTALSMPCHYLVTASSLPCHCLPTLQSVGSFQRGDFPWRWSFCGWAMTSEQDTVMIVEDAREDARYHGVCCGSWG
jgi:hypothetical protein